MAASRFLTFAAIGLAAVQPAMAQVAPPTTVLHLSATGSVQVAPDQLAAELVAQSTSSSAAMAQRQVNSMMANGMKAAQAIVGVDACAVGYSVVPGDEKHATWVAQQTLELRGADGPALLDLAGKFQERGLALASLDWQLSPPARRKAHEEATTAALKELQARAASAAATLGLHVDHLQDVRLDDALLRPRQLAPMLAAVSRMNAPPQASAAPEEVMAQVSADVLLRP
jgi:predicted secreted protein